MRTSILMAALTASGLAVSQQPALHVLRVAPADGAAPTEVVTVTFDRPVADHLRQAFAQVRKKYLLYP